MASAGTRSKAKRVCVLTSAHIAKDTRIYYKECRSLLAAGYQVTLIARDAGEAAPADIEALVLPVSGGRFGRLLATVRMFLLALRVPAELYHLHDPDLLWVGAGLHLLRGKPVIYDVHELYAELVAVRSWIPRRLKPLFRWLVDGWERFFSRWMSAFVIVVEAQRQRFAGRGVPVVLLHNYPLRSIVPDAASLAAARFEPGAVLYIGDVTAARGIWVLLEAFAAVAQELPGGELWLVGRINDGALRQRLAEWLEAHALRDRVNVVGFVTHDQLGRYLSRASVGVVPYQNVSQYLWALPTKLFEYMACSVPSVVSDLPGAHDVVAQSECGLLVEPGSAEALARGLMTLLTDPELARTMGEAGRSAVLERYNWETEEPKLLALYERLLGRR